MFSAEAVRDVDNVVVIEGAGFDPRNRTRNRQLAVERAPEAVGALLDLLAAVDLTAEPQYWTESPTHSLVLRRGRSLVAEVGLLHGGLVQMEAGGQYELPDLDAMRSWLSHRGVDTIFGS